LAEGQPLSVLRLPPGVVKSAVKVGLMDPVGDAVIVTSSVTPTTPAAVPLTLIAGLADREWHPTPAAQEQVQNRLRHQELGQTTILRGVDKQG
jgi:hypothetical protein